MTQFRARVSGALGSGWSISKRGGEIKILRNKPPTIVNMVGVDPHFAREYARAEAKNDMTTLQRIGKEYKEYQVRWIPEIVIRMTAKISQKEVDEYLLLNQKTIDSQERLSQYENSFTLKGFSGSEAKRRKLEKQYNSIWQKAKEIPVGYYKNMSVYLYKSKTDLFRYFFFPEERTKHEKAITTILGLVSKYKRVSYRIPDSYSCKYDLRLDAIPVSCPW